LLKNVKDRVWAFDAEWVPDPLAGRLLYDIPDSVSEPEEILNVMWQEGGASEEDPTPFLKTVLCRLVSIAAIERRVQGGGEVVLQLLSLPHDPENEAQSAEAVILGRFLESLGTHRPQLVGFNSIDSDLRIMVQRGVVLGLRAAGFCSRPDKPWEGIDYFARGSDWNVDLKEILGGFGRGVPSLHEAATLSGIPGKMDVDGNQVARLWLQGDLRQIVQYNEFDALTTYLLWLRVAYFAGHFDDEQYAAEQQLVEQLIEVQSAKPERAHLKQYADEWIRLRRATGQV
jgi:predicted PolB exonuclease-like 3'-5' exonuclease